MGPGEAVKDGLAKKEKKQRDVKPKKGAGSEPMFSFLVYVGLTELLFFLLLLLFF